MFQDAFFEGEQNSRLVCQKLHRMFITREVFLSVGADQLVRFLLVLMLNMVYSKKNSSMIQQCANLSN